MPTRIPDCPLARTAEQIGPWWTLEILHETYDGFTRFEEIRRNLGTPADLLADRLSALVTAGLLTTAPADGTNGGGDGASGHDADTGIDPEPDPEPDFEPDPEPDFEPDPDPDAGAAGRTAYRPTELGRSLRPLVLVMTAWGNHRLPPERRGLILVDARTGVEADPVVVDRSTGRPLDTAEFMFAAGPAAGPALRERYPRRPTPPTSA
ncbi:helix-turn-helix transcriptional regulator [Streptomyces sp. NBC_00669]|uniref:winged helix-turn-helix transcriptional regulator n=1 Tax=Streptomyces sp. NBC_00669 TaxID=2976011 RepID=UPI002E376D09|nr:helix-turn-helix domain-containing protein [Streptomyces sp. NBC_00669]